MFKKNFVKAIFFVAILAFFAFSTQRAFLQSSKDGGGDDKKAKQHADKIETDSIGANDSGYSNSGNQGEFNGPLLVGSDLGEEVEPNGTFATANPLSGVASKVRGDIYPNGDEDWYSFQGVAGNRVYAALMTSYSATAFMRRL